MCSCSLPLPQCSYGKVRKFPFIEKKVSTIHYSTITPTSTSFSTFIRKIIIDQCRWIQIRNEDRVTFYDRNLFEYICNCISFFFWQFFSSQVQAVCPVRLVLVSRLPTSLPETSTEKVSKFNEEKRTEKNVKYSIISLSDSESEDNMIFEAGNFSYGIYERKQQFVRGKKWYRIFTHPK